MPFDKHEEKEYLQDVQSVYAAALKALVQPFIKMFRVKV